MRAVFHDRLDVLGGDVAGSCSSAGASLRDATVALIEMDPLAAKRTLRHAQDMRQRLARIECDAVELLVLQAPVASDLRRVVAVMWGVGDVRRMTVLAGHVAEAVLRRHPGRVVPVELRAGFISMGRVGRRLAEEAGQALRDRDPCRGQAIARLDDEMDRLHRAVLSVLSGPGWRHGVGPAVDTALLSRFYERFADHAVSVGRRVVFQETGR